MGAILGLDTDEESDGLLRLRGFLGETDRGGRAEGICTLLRAEQLARQHVDTNVFAREGVGGLQCAA